MVSRHLRVRSIWLLGATVIVLASTSFAASTAAAGSRAAACDESWGIAPIVPTSGGWGVQATAASSASDAWVVSTGFSPEGFNFPVPQHWDGTTWTLTPLEDIGVQWLYGIASLGPSDAWAVGYAYTGFYYRYRVMVVHWDGSSWTDSPVLGRFGAYSELKSVDVVSADDVWAVGDSRQEALIEHWDGTSWSVVPGPSTGSATSSLTAVSFDAPDDGWAVGSLTRARPAPTYYVSRPLLLHWDGNRWTRDQRPQGIGELSDVAAIAPDDVWAVGSAENRAVAIHWDGVSWSIVPTPSRGASSNSTSVAALGSTDVWAVGTQRQRPGAALRTLVERWDGTSWQIEPSPDVGSKNNILADVSAVPGLILAGGYSGGGAAPLAIERCLA